MLEPEDKAPEAEDIEVVAHGDEDEELNAGCIINGSSQTDG
ncbi:hypothetical protein GCM10023195_18090 [Actinoallomurus liliacearum]|uniref:Uncharacterized protein n=1 Tax=Actinoallomurus liliacearum TaxID=1080073 RepID=A0ABP8TDB8_9ACTN